MLESWYVHVSISQVGAEGNVNDQKLTCSSAVLRAVIKQAPKVQGKNGQHLNIKVEN